MKQDPEVYSSLYLIREDALPDGDPDDGDLVVAAGVGHGHGRGGAVIRVVSDHH